ncbi:hypothetical protein CRG98_016262 [Punica granatum]|uniref:Uncharacterized protein n=1 Tax=Punica granatum TaxID=22663 RepID=A0A2I0K499_PUNGR|nr:hypothetical protein CRG98_016262 [Punica granatum]
MAQGWRAAFGSRAQVVKFVRLPVIVETRRGLVQVKLVKVKSVVVDKLSSVTVVLLRKLAAATISRKWAVGKHVMKKQAALDWAVWVIEKAAISASVVAATILRKQARGEHVELEPPKTEEEMSLLWVAEAPCFPGVVIQGQEEVALLNVEGEIWQSEVAWPQPGAEMVVGAVDFSVTVTCGEQAELRLGGRGMDETGGGDATSGGCGGGGIFSFFGTGGKEGAAAGELGVGGNSGVGSGGGELRTGTGSVEVNGGGEERKGGRRGSLGRGRGGTDFTSIKCTIPWTFFFLELGKFGRDSSVGLMLEKSKTM